MSVQITNSTHVCLYCDTVDTAFGPIFDSEADAEEFLEWLGETTGDSDARRFTSAALTNLQLDWEATR